MRILVIEDEPKIGKIIKKALTRESYAVDHATDGSEGLAMAQAVNYDVAIIDRMIPSLDGIGVVKAMRSSGIYTPVLLLTALGSTSDKTTGLDSGADDYMTKPFAIDELLARVRALIRRPQIIRSTVLKAADLTFDTTSREVKRGGKSIELTAKESALLEYLLSNPGRPYSKQALIEHVWDFDADILPNTVEVYIKYLREKIDRPFKHQLIRTVRGVGYKLEPPKKD